MLIDYWGSKQALTSFGSRTSSRAGCTAREPSTEACMATYTWTGATSNIWTVTSNWDLNSGFPGTLPSDVAVINLASASPTINSSITLGTIVMDAASGTLDMTSLTNTTTLLSVEAGEVDVHV